MPAVPSAENGQPIETFFERLSARDWAGLGELLAADVERTGPLGDLITGSEPYVDMLERLVPAKYGNDVHRITYAPDRRSAFARVTEHLAYPDQTLHLEEAYAFELDGRSGLITRIEVFWQSQQAEPGGFGEGPATAPGPAVR